MRILFLLTQDLDSPSGLGRYRPLSRELARLGHDVSIAALHPDFSALSSNKLELDGVQVHYVAPMHVRKRGSHKSYYSTAQLLPRMLNATFALTQAALRSHADVIHIGKPHPMNGAAGLLTRGLRGKPLFVDCDDYEAGSNRFSAAWQQRTIAFFEQALPRWARLVTTNTTFLCKQLRRWGVPAERIFYLPNGADFERFALPNPTEVDALRVRLGLEGKSVILYAGSLSLVNHPVDLLLDAFARLRPVVPEAVLLLVGGGEDLPYLQSQAQALGIAEATVFRGRVPSGEISLYYHLAQVSVDPVRDDPAAWGRSPLKQFESWACGVPFVTGDAGDRRLLAGSPPASLIVPPGDPDALAKAIVQLLGNPSLAAALREQGRLRAAEFSWSRLAAGLVSAYQAALSGGRP